jgi:hypothetical protein
VREWEKVDAYFGMGNYMCLGKNIAMMELYKITAEVSEVFIRQWKGVVGGGVLMGV